MFPICIFVYKRADTTRRMMDSLLRCPECAESELHVFMDAARNESEVAQVKQVRDMFDNMQGFKSVHLYPALVNKGLASSVIDGVTAVLSKNDSVIVLEDDLEVSSDFLSFMNEALDAYRGRQDIWSISGYTPVLDGIERYDPNGVFLVPRAQCWGWATWADRWNTVDWQVKDFDSLAKDKKRRKAFDMGGDDLFRTLDMERHNRIESWAVRWAYAASKQGMLTVNPMQSKVQNVGMSSSDSHAGWHDARHNVTLLGNTTIIDPNVQPDDFLIKAFKKHHDLGFISKVGYFLRRYNLGYGFLKKLIS